MDKRDAKQSQIAPPSEICPRVHCVRLAAEFLAWIRHEAGHSPALDSGTFATGCCFLLRRRHISSIPLVPGNRLHVFAVCVHHSNNICALECVCDDVCNASVVFHRRPDHQIRKRVAERGQPEEYKQAVPSLSSTLCGIRDICWLGFPPVDRWNVARCSVFLLGQLLCSRIPWSFLRTSRFRFYFRWQLHAGHFPPSHVWEFVRALQAAPRRLEFGPSCTALRAAK